MLSFRIRGFLGAILFFIATAVAAATDSQYFDKGMKAFRSGDYQQAAESFEQARKAGMEIPAIYYNLGVSYYHLGDWEKAEDMFLRTSRFADMAPLAFYNLGLVNLKKGDKQKAKLWFAEAVQATDDARLKKMASDQLDKLVQVREAWLNFVSVGGGYDSNVTLDNDTLTSVSSKSDYFMEVYGYTRGVLQGTSDDGVLLKASLFGDVYRTETDYNLIEGNVGIYKSFPLSAWNNEAGGYVTYSTLGGEGYLQSGNLSWATTRNFSKQYRLRMRVRLRQISAVDSQYSAVDGNAQDFRIEGRWVPNPYNKLRATYQLELNDRNGSETATTFSSLSPTRNTVKLEYTRLLGENWTMRMSGAYRNSSYSQDNIEADGTVIQRNDDRWRGYFELSRILNKNTTLSFDYTYTDNSSNIERYSYTQSIVMANLLFLF
jgi:Tfp pilus assembly protein PilF